MSECSHFGQTPARICTGLLLAVLMAPLAAPIGAADPIPPPPPLPGPVAELTNGTGLDQIIAEFRDYVNHLSQNGTSSAGKIIDDVMFSGFCIDFRPGPLLSIGKSGEIAEVPGARWDGSIDLGVYVLVKNAKTSALCA